MTPAECPKCGAPGVPEPMPAGSPHYAKLVCSGPERHYMKFLPHPRPGLDDLDVPDGLPEGAPLPSLAGTFDQVAMAATTRPQLIARLRAWGAPDRVVRAAWTIEDSTWWLMNRTAGSLAEIKWPSSWARKVTVGVGLEKVISGGQTGVDIAGLRAARAAGIATGGTAAKGWLIRPPGGTGDIRAPWLADFGLVESDSPGYPARTEANVRAADFTLVFVAGTAGPGTKLTLDLLRRAGKPFLVVIRDSGSIESNPAVAARTLHRHGVKVLNVAGSREDTSLTVEDWVKSYLGEMFAELRRLDGMSS